MALELKPAWLHSPRMDSSPAGRAPAPAGQPNPPTGPAFQLPHSHRDGPRIQHGPIMPRRPNWEPAFRSRYTGAALPFFSVTASWDPVVIVLLTPSPPFRARVRTKEGESPSPAILFTLVDSERVDATLHRLSALLPPLAGAIYAMTPSLWPVPLQPPLAPSYEAWASCCAKTEAPRQPTTVP